MKKKLFFVFISIFCQAISADTTSEPNKYLGRLPEKLQGSKDEILREIEDHYKTKEEVLYQLKSALVRLKYFELPKNNDLDCNNKWPKDIIERQLFDINNAPDFEDPKIIKVKAKINNLTQRVISRKECEEQKALLAQKKTELEKQV